MWELVSGYLSVENSSSVCGNLTDLAGILLPVPPQTEVNFEEEQLIYLVSMLPFIGESLRKSRADWKTKHDSARVSYSTGKVWKVRVKVRDCCSSEFFRLLNSCTHVEIPHPMSPWSHHSMVWFENTGINICCTGASLPACYCVGELPPWLPGHPKPCYL